MAGIGTWELSDALAEKDGGVQRDVDATVRRLDEDGTVWVESVGGSEFPATAALADVEPGDTVTVRIENGRATIVGSTSAPSISASRASEMMVPIADAASQAQVGAAIAQEMAENATKSAGEAGEAAAAAATAAGEAATSASQASTSASQAASDASAAHQAADSALKGLAEVEDVVGVVNWLAEHSKQTEDTVAEEGKAYYTKDAQTGKLTRVEVPEGGNPAQLGLWELDEAVRDFLAAHLALTDAGLNLMVDGADGMRMHLGTVVTGDDAKPLGTYILDEDGEIVASFGKDGAQIGKDADGSIAVSSSGVGMMDGDSTVASFSVDSRWGYPMASMKMPGLDISSTAVYAGGDGETYIIRENGSVTISAERTENYAEGQLSISDDSVRFRSKLADDSPGPLLGFSRDEGLYIVSKHADEAELSAVGSRYEAKNNMYGTCVRLGCSEDSFNHGVYSPSISKWLVNTNLDDVYVNGIRLTNLNPNLVLASSPDSTNPVSNASFRKLASADLPTVPVGKGGTGQTGTYQEDAGIITPGSGITITSQIYSKWGKLAQLNLKFKASSAIANGAAVNLGTVASGMRPNHLAAGGSSFMSGYVAANGAIQVRNIQGSSLAAGTEREVGFTYLLP